MSNVFVDKNKIDLLANAISAKSGESLTLTLDEMVEAVDGIDTSGGGITPTGNIDISSAGVTDVTNYATATVPSADPWLEITTAFSGSGNNRTWTATPKVLVDVAEGDTAGFMADGYEKSGTLPLRFNTVPSNTTITPTTSSQTIGGTNYMMEGAVTVSAMPTGTAGTPTATKGAVSNHSVSVTPSVTNTAGYISGGTKTGTAVTVSASELVSGDKSITENGNNIDVANYSTVSVNVSGGGGSSVKTGTQTTAAMDAVTLRFYITEEVDPTSFVVTSLNNITTSSPATISTVVYDGTNLFNQSISTTSNANVLYANSGISKSYSDGYLTLTSSTNYFSTEATYKIVYSYDGSSANINTADVQVGSGATSITFTGLEDEPLCWSCVFKSNFSTSSGYQRVICVVNDGTNTYGMEMDSSAKYSSAHWTATYNNGSLTITSQGTNAGGYFHQPGYYQLTYVIADASPYEKKSATYRASTSAQTDTIEPSSGYDAMSEVNISIPAVTQTNLTADNIKSGTTVTISNGQSNLWSITGTYGGGGSSKNAQSVQGTTRTTSSTLTAIGAEMTVSKTGTYDVYWSAFRSNTSTQYTFGTQLYINGTGYGSEQTTWSNHIQNVHLSNVSLTANDTIRVYGRESRGSSYYMYAGTLTIIEA